MPSIRSERFRSQGRDLDRGAHAAAHAVDTFVRTVLTFKVGAAIEREALTAAFSVGVPRVSVVEIPGEFSIRGGIVDIFSTAYTEPLRVEFLGETVESLRLFDPATQKVHGENGPRDRAAGPRIFEGRHRPRCPRNPGGRRMARAGPLWRDADALRVFYGRTAARVESTGRLEAVSCSTLWERIDDGYLRHSDKDETAPYPSPERLFLTWQDITDRTSDCTQLALSCWRKPMSPGIRCTPSRLRCRPAPG